jgi:hypothetical protein
MIPMSAAKTSAAVATVALRTTRSKWGMTFASSLAPEGVRASPHPKGGGRLQLLRL